MGLREQKKQEQRRAILDTTVTFFREQGFEETRVRDVTGRLRISEGTFFNFFPSKQAVLDATALDLLERVTALLHRDASEDTRPAAERLEEIVAAFATGFAGDREFATLLARHTQFFLGRWSEEQWQEKAYRPLTRLIEDGQRRGEIRGDIPASQLAELYVGINLLTISNWLAGSPGHGALDRRLLQAWSVFRDGSITAGAPANAPRRAVRRDPPTGRSLRPCPHITPFISSPRQARRAR